MSVNTYACLRCVDNVHCHRHGRNNASILFTRSEDEPLQVELSILASTKSDFPWQGVTSIALWQAGAPQTSLELYVVLGNSECIFFFSAHNAFYHPIVIEAILYTWPLSSSQTIREYCSDPRARCLFRSSRKFRKSCLTNTSVKVTDQPEH